MPSRIKAAARNARLLPLIQRVADLLYEFSKLPEQPKEAHKARQQRQVEFCAARLKEDADAEVWTDGERRYAAETYLLLHGSAAEIYLKDRPEAESIEALKREVPGLPHKMYVNLLGWFAAAQK